MGPEGLLDFKGMGTVDCPLVHFYLGLYTGFLVFSRCVAMVLAQQFVPSFPK
jgi:hypothetical protein